ncbi:MAG: TrmH family RNA methyltransferase [Acidobacteriaceae bacterium]
MPTTLLPIASRQNSHIKQLRAAFAGNLRLSGGLVAIEGEHLLGEALRSGLELEAIFVQAGREALLQNLQLPARTPAFLLEEDVFTSAVATETPQGIAALLQAPQFVQSDLLPHDAVPLILVAAGLQDPGNLGTLIRSAEAFGASGIVSLPGTVSAWNQKAVRASAGSIFRVPLVKTKSQDDFAWLHQAGVKIFAAVADDGLPLTEVDLRGPSALLIGNEGAGLSAELIALADERITIPCPGPVESLNAAVAGSLLLYEAARQRAEKSARR